jgi:hypothetical protein
MIQKIYFRLIFYLFFWQLYLFFISNNSPLGSEWLPWHYQRLYNFSEYLKLNGYFLNYGFSIWSSCDDCSLSFEYWTDKIYLSSSFISQLPSVIINHFFGSETLKQYGHLSDKAIIFFSGILISELFIKLSGEKKKMLTYFQAFLCFIFFSINPWTYKMILAHWAIVFFLFFYLMGILMLLNNNYNLGLIFFFIAGLFSVQSSAGIAFFFILLLFLFFLKQQKFNYDKYFLNINNLVLNYKIIFSLLAPVLIYFTLRQIAVSEYQIVGGSSFLGRVGISGNDIHNGSLLGALQFMGGNRITQCLVNFNMNIDIKNLSNSIEIYNCILSTLSMYLVSLLSIIGLFYLNINYKSFTKLIIFPILFLFLSYTFILQQSSSAHLMGYSYLFSVLFSVGITSMIFSILKKYNYSIVTITLSVPVIIGLMILCIRVSMLTGLNG